MQCRSCGTEIADKAIICFRCGAGTTDPVRQAARIPWTSRDGMEMETVVEIAMVQAGASSRTETWRVSIYEQNPRRRRKRVMIGDSAEFLGA